MQRIGRLYPVLMLLLTPIVRAQGNADALFDLSLENLLEIKIESASKSEDTLRDIPNTVTIITRDEIAVMGYASLEELLINLPSIYHIDTYEDFQIGVRGIVGGSMAFLVNGILQHPTRIKVLTIPDRSRTNIPIDSIDRIEFVRGPSSVIYGNNAFLGSINIITNNTEEAHNKVSAASGSNGYGRAFVRVSKQFSSGGVTVNLGSFQTQGIGGDINAMLSSQQRSGLEERYPGYKQDLQGTLEHENYNLDVSGNYHSLDYGFRYSKMQYGIYPLGPANQSGSELELSSWLASLATEQSFTENLGLSVVAIMSNEAYDIHPDYWRNHDEGHQHQSANRYELESVLKYDSQGVRGILGVNYRIVDDISSDIHIQINPQGDFFEEIRKSDAVDSLGIFGNANLKLSTNFSLVAGYRYTMDSDYTLYFDGPAITSEEAQRAVPAMHNNASKIALLYDFTRRQSFKASYSTATQNNRSYALFEPEEIESWELNYSFSGENFNVSGSAFVNHVERINRQLQEFEDSAFGKSEDNSGEWYTQGVELIGLVRPNSRLTFEFSSVLQETTDRAVAEEIPVGNSPELVAKIKFGYGFTNWKLASSLIYVDEMLSDYRVHQLDNSVIRYGAAVQSYFLINGNIRYQQPNSDWYVSVHGFNIADEDVFYAANELVDFYRGTYGPGRQVSIVVGVDF